MNPESHDHKNLLLDALLQEQHRTDREQAIKAIEDAIAASATTTTAIEKRKQRWPWAIGLAASAAIGVGVLHQNGIIGQSEDIIAYHKVEESPVEKQSVTAHIERENSKDLRGAGLDAATAAPAPPPLIFAPTYHNVSPPAPTTPDTTTYYRPDATTNANLGGLKAIPVEDYEQFDSPGDKRGPAVPMEEMTKSVTRTKEGELSVTGSIIKFQVTPVAATAQDRAAENRLTIDVEVDFVDAKNDKKNIWKY